MSLGSAASLPGSMPQAPLSPPRTIEGVRAFNVSAQVSGFRPPPRSMPLQKSAEDPPLGRILVVEDRAADALELQQVLKDLGYRVIGPAGSALEAERLVQRRREWPLRCALLDAACPGLGPIGQGLRARGTPIVWVLPSDLSLPVPFAAPIVRLPALQSELLAAITIAGREAPPPSCYVTPPPQEAWPRVFPQL
jgi:hypothetical protein